MEIIKLSSILFQIAALRSKINAFKFFKKFNCQLVSEHDFSHFIILNFFFNQINLLLIQPPYSQISHIIYFEIVIQIIKLNIFFSLLNKSNNFNHRKFCIEPAFHNRLGKGPRHQSYKEFRKFRNEGDAVNGFYLSLARAK